MRSLTEADRTILGHIERAPEAPLQDLAKELRISYFRLYRAIQRLEAAGIVGSPRPQIDLGRIGYGHHSVYVALGVRNERPLDKFLQTLVSNRAVTWAFLVGGAHQVGFSLTTRTVNEAASELSKIISSNERAVVRSSAAVQTAFRYYGRRHLTKVPSRPSPPKRASARAPSELDDHDWSILSAMVEKGTIAIAEVSRETGIPVATVARRRDRLVETGVITGYTRWLNLEGLGYSIFLLIVRVRNQSEPLTRRLKSFIDEHPEVIFLSECFGAWQYELGVEVVDFSAVTVVVQELYCELGDALLDVEVVPVFRYLKHRGLPAT